MSDMHDEMKSAFLTYALSAIGQKVSLDFAEFINRYPPQLRPIVIGQVEALAAATKATFSEEDRNVADKIRDASRIITVLKKPEV